MTPGNKMLDTSKKKYLPWVQLKKNSSEYNDWKLTFFTLRQNKTKTFGKKILENKNHFSNEQHGFSSCQGVWTFPNQRLLGILPDSQKDTPNQQQHRMDCSHLPPDHKCYDAVLPLPLRSWCLDWDTAHTAWICHLCISTPSSSAPWKRRCWWVALCLPSAPSWSLVTQWNVLLWASCVSPNSLNLSAGGVAK